MTKTPLAAIALMSLVAGSVASADELVVRRGEKSYVVQVVAPDTAARTLTVRGDAGSSTLPVDETALGGLQGLQPGDTITISVRDATGERRAVTAIVNGTLSTARASERSAPRGTSSSAAIDPTPVVAIESATGPLVVRETPGTTVELANLDPKTRKVTLIDSQGDKRVYHVDANESLQVGQLEPGQKLLLSYRFGRDAKTEAVVRVMPAVRPARSAVGSTSVEVVSINRAANTLTVRDADGQRTYVVDPRVDFDINELKSGEAVVIGLQGERIVVLRRP
jgi:hypothetical protein